MTDIFEQFDEEAEHVGKQYRILFNRLGDDD